MRRLHDIDHKRGHDGFQGGKGEWEVKGVGHFLGVCGRGLAHKFVGRVVVVEPEQTVVGASVHSDAVPHQWSMTDADGSLYPSLDPPPPGAGARDRPPGPGIRKCGHPVQGVKLGRGWMHAHGMAAGLYRFFRGRAS